MKDYSNCTSACLDWLRGIVKTTNVVGFINDLAAIDSRLSFDNFSEWTGGGLLNYSRRFVHNEVPSITFAYNPFPLERPDSLIAEGLKQDNEKKRNPFILLSLSGDALRYIGDKSLKAICKYLYQNDFVCTRIDYALDMFDGCQDLVSLLSEAFENFICPEEGNLTIKSKIQRVPSNMQIHQYQYPKGSDFQGNSFKNYTLGNHGSDHGMFRLYNKHFECLYGRNKQIGEQLLDGRKYWYRAEIELHNSNARLWAAESFNNLVLQDFPVTSCWANAMDNYFTLVFSPKDSRYLYRAEECQEWVAFVSYLYKCIDFV